MHSLARLATLIGALCVVVAAGASPLAPEPTGPEPKTIRPSGESPVYYRLPDDRVIPGFELGVGLGRHLDDSTSAFAIAPMLGVRMSPQRGWQAGALAQAGLVIQPGHDLGVAAGVGPMWRQPPTTRSDLGFPEGPTLAWVPQALLTGDDGRAAWGVRHGLVLTFWIYGLTVAHQMVLTAEGPVQQVQILFTSHLYQRWRR
jgi:hypothetical protein